MHTLKISEASKVTVAESFKSTRQSEVKESLGDICARESLLNKLRALSRRRGWNSSVRAFFRLGWRFASAGSNCTCCSPVCARGGDATRHFYYFISSLFRLQLCVTRRAIGQRPYVIVQLLRCALLIWPISPRDAAREWITLAERSDYRFSMSQHTLGSLRDASSKDTHQFFPLG